MALKRDLYMIMGIAPVATAEEIKKAYRALTKKYHPDLNPEMKLYSDEKMKELVEAYNTLSDMEKRKEYGKSPHFMVKRQKKSPAGRGVKADPENFTRKPKYDREPSMLERILSPFVGKKDKDRPVNVDYKQADTHFTIGLSMADNESFFEKARLEFKEALKYDPSFSEALYNYALLSYKLGDFDEARVHFQKYLFLEKDDSYARKFIEVLSEDFQ